MSAQRQARKQDDDQAPRAEAPPEITAIMTGPIDIKRKYALILAAIIALSILCYIGLFYLILARFT